MTNKPSAPKSGKAAPATEKEMPKEETLTPPAPSVVPFSQADVSTRYDDVYEWVVPDEVADVRWRDGAYEFTCRNRVTLRVQVLTPGIVRLRYSPDGHFGPDFSYARSPDFETGKVVVTLRENAAEYLLASEQVQVVISKSGLRARFYDLDDRVLCEDAEGYSAKRTILQGWSELRMSKKCHRREVFFGLGDKSCALNLSGKKFENWCTDAFAYGKDSDPLYRAIPFYYAHYQGLTYGIFLDNSYKTHFDFTEAAQGETSFWAEGGELNYYFLYGPSPQEVARAYARLTGVPELPPLWAMGYHQCRWSYYPDSRVHEVSDTFRELAIPCDAIYLDIDYMDGYRCFTWDEVHFPDPKHMIDALREKGFQTVVMIDPGIKEDPDYHVYKEGLERNMFVRTSDGEVAKAPVWPGFCAFPDFTHPAVRAWWGDLYANLYRNLGVSGFWNDMNEPAVFHVHHKTLPDAVLHHYEGHPCSHRKAHNIYGLQMSRASWEGYKRLRPEKRPYLLTRATFSGGQRFSAVWTGDNVSDWDHLRIANVQCQRLSVSGFSFCGTDIGGFTGTKDGELFTRWLQLGVFHPLMRVHSMGQHLSGDALATDDTPATAPTMKKIEQEPWVFGEKWTAIAKKAIELRYCLLPVLYTAMWRNTQDGTPVIQHLGFADPTDARLWEQERDFMFGEHLLVSPVVQSKAQRQSIYLPKGNWYYFWTGQPASGEMFVNVMPDQIPFFVREGAVLPVYPIRQHTGEPIDLLTLYCYYKNGVETSQLYEDAGEGYAYQQGGFSLKIFDTEGLEDRFVLRQRTGTPLRANIQADSEAASAKKAFATSYQKVKVYLVGFPVFVKHCTVDGADVPIKEIRLRDRSLYTLEIGAAFEKIEWTG